MSQYLCYIPKNCYIAHPNLPDVFVCRIMMSLLESLIAQVEYQEKTRYTRILGIKPFIDEIFLIAYFLFNAHLAALNWKFRTDL